MLLPHVFTSIGSSSAQVACISPFALAYVFFNALLLSLRPVQTAPLCTYSRSGHIFRFCGMTANCRQLDGLGRSSCRGKSLNCQCAEIALFTFKSPLRRRLTDRCHTAATYGLCTYKETGFRVILSLPCFPFWLLVHSVAWLTLCIQPPHPGLAQWSFVA